ncbi:PAS domain S-box protein [Thermodesulfobacteriota bacterium]
MHPVAILDLISLLASSAALIFLIIGWKRALERDVKFVLAGLFVFNLLYSLCLYAEWSGMTKAFDPYEDIIGAMLPMWWAFVFYAFLQQFASIDLLQSDEKYRELVEGTDDFIAQVDREGRFTFVNDTAAKIFGLSKEECIGLSAFDFIHPDDQERTMVAFKDWILNRVSSAAFENRQVNQKTGEVHYLHWAINFHYDEKKKIIGINGIARDITERKRAEKALRDSEEQLHTLLQNIQAAVVVHGPDTKIIKCNKASQKLLGLTEDQMLGKKAIDPLWRFYNEDGSNMPPEHYPVNRVIATQNVLKDFIIGIYRPNKNDVVNILVNAVPEIDLDGNLSKVIVTFMDITERKRLEEERRELENQLQQAKKMEAIATLAGGVAHQFNNALTPIIGNIEFLEMESPVDENIAKYIEPMKDSTQRMIQLTSQLLAYARGGKYQAEITSMNDFVRDTIPLLKHILQPSIDVDTNLSHDSLSIKADLTQMQMVIAAILQNASEAMEDNGRIKISSKNEEIDEASASIYPGINPGSYVGLAIEDDGTGMDEETRNRVFEPFFTTKFQGRGLGMAAAYGIIKNHNGWIIVDSELNKGTIVRIFLPVTEEKPTEIKKPKIESIKGTGTVLVVEDEELVMNVNRMILERLGYRILEARTGQEAVDVAKTFEGEIHIALLDIILPDLKGKAIYPLLMEARPNMKVIVCSGYSIDGPAREIIAAGAQGFIQKPFSMVSLSEKLKEVLNGK